MEFNNPVKFSNAEPKPAEDIMDVMIDEKEADDSLPAARQVRCPYCHGWIPVDNFLFRAENPETKESLAAKADTLSARELEELNAYLEKPDARLKEFWAMNMGWGENSTVLREANGGYSEIEKKVLGIEIDKVTCCVLNDEQIKSREVAGDGYVKSVTDTRGKKTTKKICPHCHCLLPEKYGLHNVFFIACIGIHGSGKTVLLSESFKRMQNEFAKKAGVTIWPHHSSQIFVDEKKIAVGEPLPKYTSTMSIKPPIIIEINNARKKTFTLVFYDMAGENCTNEDGMTRYGFFLKNVDGIMMLISPEQLPNDIPKIENNETEENEELLSVLNCIHNAFNEKSNDKTSFAIVLSKSDHYRAQDGNPTVNGIDENVNYKRKKGFMIEQHQALHENIEQMLEDTALKDYAKDLYQTATYFAVSTLGAPPKTIDGQSYPPDEINPIRLEEPFLWFLNQFGIIPSVNDYSISDTIVKRIKEAWEFLYKRLKGGL